VTWVVPLIVAAVMPTTEPPGMRPRSPLIVDGPVLVAAEPASRAKEPAVPRPTPGCAALDLAGASAKSARTPAAVLRARVCGMLVVHG
jgi:hypothetical protein